MIICKVLLTVNVNFVALWLEILMQQNTYVNMDIK